MRTIETFVIKVDNTIFWPTMKGNQRGFTIEELKDFEEILKGNKYEIISIDEEIKKYSLQGDNRHKQLLGTEVFQYETWNNAYSNNNINGFNLPLSVESNEDYLIELRKVYSTYLRELNKPAFVYEDNLLEEIDEICNKIMQCLERLIDNKLDEAKEIMKEVILKFITDSFIVSQLDETYSFRGIAPFEDIQSDGYDSIYEEMKSKELTFFRVRTKKKTENIDISAKEHMLHLPHTKKEQASSMRFSRKGVPCLYLGTTSYVCSGECGWNVNEEEMYVAAFTPNEEGKRLKILNLTVSQALINGIYHGRMDKDNGIRHELQIKMLEIFPLVIATSFSVKEKEREFKYEYLISQILMEVISELNIDGIAYLSMKGKDEFQYPHGVNLALPAYDISEKKQHSKYCEMFYMTDPVLFDEQRRGDKKSYINSVYRKYDVHGNESFVAKVDLEGQYVFYGDTKYGVFDNYLVSQTMEEFVTR